MLKNIAPGYYSKNKITVINKANRELKGEAVMVRYHCCDKVTLVRKTLLLACIRTNQEMKCYNCRKRGRHSNSIDYSEYKNIRFPDWPVRENQKGKYFFWGDQHS